MRGLRGPEESGNEGKPGARPSMLQNPRKVKELEASGNSKDRRTGGAGKGGFVERPYKKQLDPWISSFTPVQSSNGLTSALVKEIEL